MINSTEITFANFTSILFRKNKQKMYCIEMIFINRVRSETEISVIQGMSSRLFNSDTSEENSFYGY